MAQPFLSILRSKYNHLLRSCIKQYFRLVGMKIKKGVQLGKISCNWPPGVCIGNKCTIQDYVHFEMIQKTSQEYNTTIGDNVFIGRQCEFICNDKIIIGNDCLIASNCVVGNRSRLRDGEFTSALKGQVILGNDVWLGAGCVIETGIQIGDGSIIGAGSVVTGSIPCNQIWMGNPAKFYSDRT